MYPELQIQEVSANLGEARFCQLSPLKHERRSVRRYAVELEVTVTSEHNFYDGLVRDMGVAGVFIGTYTPHQNGEVIELSIRLPGDDQPIKAFGQVRWSRAHSAGGAMPGIGVKFLGVSPEDQARIGEFLRTREPLLYDD